MIFQGMTRNWTTYCQSLKNIVAQNVALLMRDTSSIRRLRMRENRLIHMSQNSEFCQNPVIFFFFRHNRFPHQGQSRLWCNNGPFMKQITLRKIINCSESHRYLLCSRNLNTADESNVGWCEWDYWWQRGRC